MASKTHCVWGHEFSPENTYITSAGARVCRTCKRRRQNAYDRRTRPVYTPPTEVERFWSKVAKAGPDECWLWQATKTGGIPDDPYGYFMAGSRTTGNSRMVGAHRWVYEHEVGPIPEGYHIDHLCFTRTCVNPSHLEAVTHQENLRRARERVLT